jgi:RTX calcium-binding nonapeptide repeat (4 copies)
VIRQSHLIAVVGVFLMGCAFLLLVGGCAGVRSEAPQKEEQARSDRCEGTRTIKKSWGLITTNDVPGCPKGGLLSGTDKADDLAGEDGDDEIHGLGAGDYIWGGLGNDVIYGGPASDDINILDGDEGDDVLYGDDGPDLLWGDKGEDVLYGGKGNDGLDGSSPGGEDAPTGRGTPMRDELYCGPGKDEYHADRLDYVDSSCEEKVNLICCGG